MIPDGLASDSDAGLAISSLILGPYVCPIRKWHTVTEDSTHISGGNIGNAKIEGLQEDLGLLGYQYNWCLTAFFFTYAAFEVPSNLLLKRLRPSRWLPTIMVAWGLVMTLMGLVQNYHGLLVARLFLGVAEAGLYPGVAASLALLISSVMMLSSRAPKLVAYTCADEPWHIQYYLTMWYCRHEIQFRQALFFSAASVAGAFSGLLAFGISKMDGVGDLAGWRWIFILEGIATVLVAFASFWLLHDFPETAAFLTEDERAFVVYRLRYQGQSAGAAQVAQADEFRWKYVGQAFADWQIWANVFVYWGVRPSSSRPQPPGGLPSVRLTMPDRMPPLRHQLLPAHHRQEPRLHLEHGAAADGPHLRGGRRPGRRLRVPLGPPRPAQPLHPRLPVPHGRRLRHVHRDGPRPAAGRGVRGRVPHRLRHLPQLPGQRLVAVE